MHYGEKRYREHMSECGHLSATEEGFYIRAECRYKALELPLEADRAALHRKLRASTPEEYAAIEQILQDFFVLGEDGWRHLEWDRQIAAYHEGAPQRDRKRDGERARLERHRDERAELFAELASAGVRPPYNTHIGDLRKKVQDVRSACLQNRNASSETLDTFQATAVETLDTTTNNQQPVTNNQEPNTALVSDANVCVGFDPMNYNKQVCAAMKEEGLIGVSASDPEFIQLLEAGAKIEHFKSAAAIAVAAKKKWRYALGIVRNQLSDAQSSRPTLGAGGKNGRSSIEAEGVELGLGKWDEAAFGVGRGESFMQYEARIQRAKVLRAAHKELGPS